MTTTFVEGANYISTGTVLSTTVETTVYTCPTGFQAANVVWIHASDDGATSQTLTLTWTDSSAATSYTLLSAGAIAAGSVYNEDFNLALEAGDTIKATAGATGLHVVVTVHQIARRKS